MAASVLGVELPLGPVPALDPALAAAVNAAVRLTGADVAGVLLADPPGDTAEMQACAGRWTVHSANLRVRRGRGLAGRILQTRKPWKVDDYAIDRSIHADEFFPVLVEEGTRAGLGAPMIVGDTLVGVLMAWSRRCGAFDVAATQALVNLADLTALAVVNGRRAEELERRLTATARRLRERTERVVAHEHAAEVRAALTSLLLAGGDLTALLTAVCARSGGDAAVFDTGLGELAACGAAGPIRDRVARHVRRSGAEPSTVLPPGPGFPRWTVLRAVLADGEALARLALCLPHMPTPADHETTAQAAVACALHLTRERAVLDARSRVHADFVWQLLDGLVDEAVAVVRARQLGCVLPSRLRVVVVPVGTGAEDDRRRLDALVAAAERLARSAGGNALAGRRGATLALVVEADDDTGSARATVEEVVLGLRRRAPGAVGIAGVSACVDFSADLRGAYRQAQHALAAAAFGPEGNAVLFDELGLLRFLLAPSDRSDQLRFARAVLGPVIDYDRQHHTDLVGTLGSYLDGGCSLTRAAEGLYVHPKTVRYRLRRVEELTHRDLSAQRDRFDAQLAVAILRALSLDGVQTLDGAQDPPPATVPTAGGAAMLS